MELPPNNGLILICCFLFMADIDEDTNPGGIVYGVCVHAWSVCVCVCVLLCMELPPINGFDFDLLLSVYGRYCR